MVSSAENMTELLINANSLMAEFGINAEEGKDQLVDMFLDGAISLEELNDGFNSLNFVSNETMAKSINTEPRIALSALQLSFKRLAAEGIDTWDEISAYLMEHFGPDVVEAFQKMKDAGIEDFTDLSNLSSEQFRQLFNELVAIAQDIGDVFGFDASKGVEEFKEKSKDTMNEVDRDIGRVRENVRGLGRDYDRVTESVRDLRRAQDGLDTGNGNNNENLTGR